ncbi:MAG: hypothetical protein GYA17_09425 [Chloroflexi bacterium]|nr:SRPBCC family protein [Anaerolineaceae bacterium]NMB88568.1 hypothetical protein [Chloroflexota bacterium]
MIQFETSILIDRPMADVAAFLADPLNLPRWQSMVLDIQPTSAGPLGAGSTFATTSEVMGRRLEGRLQISHYDLPEQLGFSVTSGPMSVHIDLRLKPAGSGVKLGVHAQGEPGGALKLAGPMLERQVRSQMEANLARLKTVLESGAA